MKKFCVLVLMFLLAAALAAPALAAGEAPREAPAAGEVQEDNTKIGRAHV